jgi:signal transduction histidine kinase
MTLKRLKLASILGALAVVAVLEGLRYLIAPPALSWPTRLLIDLVVLTGAALCFGGIFRFAGRVERRLERRNSELLALHAAALDICRELSLEVVLQKVVDQACQLLGARYGALSVVDAQNRIEAFLTAGLSPEERAKIGPPPQGHGLLGVVLREGQRLRLADLGRDARSAGFPPHHPPMRSLLAVPIPANPPFRGNLYVAEKAGTAEFTAEDEETLVRFAVLAGLAIDNAHLHQRVQALAVAEERLRIAHEMHDGLAQVLAYVNTKAQAVREFLRAGRAQEAEDQLDQLAGAAREVYADVRESIIGLRAASSPDHTVAQALTEYIASWERQSEVPCSLEIDPDLRLPAGVELQLVRILHEALANVRKHAQAGRAEVRVVRAGGKIVARVEDDGVGFQPDDLGRTGQPRFGLVTMRERAQAVGGAVELDSAPGRGTRVRVEIPVPTTA